MKRNRVVIICFGFVLFAAGFWPRKSRLQTEHAQEPPESDPTAKYMIDIERSWAESGCTHQPGAQKFLADDFQGTAPSGERYDKSRALQMDSSSSERQCHLDEAKVRFFGSNLTIVYGSERALRKARDGIEGMRCLVWTDTWLKRNNEWQIVAAQDTAVPCKSTCALTSKESARLQKLATAAVSVEHVSNIGSSRAISNACLKFGPRLQSLRLPPLAFVFRCVSMSAPRPALST
jgi:Domain of unknown function (DUF4440)